MMKLLLTLLFILLLWSCSQRKVPISELSVAIQDIYGKQVAPQKGTDGITYRYMLKYNDNVWGLVNDAASLKEKFCAILRDTPTDTQINRPDKGASPYLRNIYKWKNPLADIQIEAKRSIDDFSENEMIIVIKKKNLSR